MNDNIIKLHDKANEILGITKSKNFEPLFRLIFINNNEDIKANVKLYSNKGLIINPIKISRNNTIEYNLEPGMYKLRCFNDDKEIYFEEIYVSEEMLGMSRTLKCSEVII